MSVDQASTVAVVDGGGGVHRLAKSAFGPMAFAMNTSGEKKSQSSPPPLQKGFADGISMNRAKNCLFVNQLATPGLGSLLGRRWIAGSAQLVLAVLGFALFLVWFGRTIHDYYQLMSDQGEMPESHWRWALMGVLFMGAAWSWAWVTSLSLLREARENARRVRAV